MARSFPRPAFGVERLSSVGAGELRSRQRPPHLLVERREQSCVFRLAGDVLVFVGITGLIVEFACGQLAGLLVEPLDVAVALRAHRVAHVVAAFLLAVSFKFAGMSDTAGYIAAAGFPFPLLLAWVAAFFEVALALGFLTGAWLSEVAVAAAAYVLFLAFSFHGPARWEGNQVEFGFFVDHFTFIAGLLFAAVHGPGERLALQASLLNRSSVSA